jgi:radical SAM protein with 4Fe4S-binding SPASM domain
MCGQDAFDQVVENIRALKEGGIHVSINLSITPYNRQDLERIHAIARELGVNVRASAYMYPPVRVNGGQYGCGNRLPPEDAAEESLKWDLLRFSPEEFSLRARNMKNLAASGEKECPIEGEEGVRCRAGSTAFWVTWDGKMLPCGMMPEPVANPLEVGFDAAWEQVKKDTAAIRLPAACTACPKKEVCPACAAVCVTETGRFDGVPGYVCRMTDATVEKTWNAYLERKAGPDED